MATYPTPGAYQEALQFPSAVLLDDDLKEAEVQTDVLGLPRVVTGAFAAVFTLHGRTRSWAVKCFLTDVPDQHQRYRAVAHTLGETEVRYTVPFEYQPGGIRVEGRRLPILKMAWSPGQPLDRFVRRHLDRLRVLDDLAERWARLVADLEAAGIAHGDLQHGNILVETDGDEPTLRLVDYDTMYVPALRGKKSPEVGHRNYQHPDRDESDFGPYLDRFSALVIYLALRASARRPELWERFDTGENLLFQAADFFDPGRSELFANLASLPGEEVVVEALAQACLAEPEDVPSLAEVRAGRSSVGRRSSAGRKPRIPAESRRARKTRRRTRVRDGFERWFGGVLVGLVVGGMAVAAVGPAGPAAVGVLIGVLGMAWAVAGRYRRLGPVRRRRRLQRELAFFDRRIAQLEQRARRAAESRAHLVQHVEEMRQERLEALQEEALEERLKYHFTDEARSFEGITHRVIVRLKNAGIRNAYQATPERLGEIRQLGHQSKTRVARWRNALVTRYESDVPDALTPAESRRFERYIAHRLDAIDAERERLQAKRDVQERERSETRDRLAAVSAPTFLQYLAYLLRLSPALPGATDADAPRPAPVRSDPEAAPQTQEAPGDDQPWWKRAS